MNERDEDQSQDSPFGIPQSSNNDGTKSSNNIPSTSSSTSPLGLEPNLIASPSKGLDLGYIIGIIVAVTVAIFLIIALIDVLLLSSRIQKSILRNGFLKLNGRRQSASFQYHSRWNEKLDKKPLPTIPDPAFLSSNRRRSDFSGYSESRYSRSMSFDSGVGWGRDEEEGYAKSFIRGGREWDEKSMRSTAKSAKSARQERESKDNRVIRPGMGVGKGDDEGEGEWYSMYEESIYTDDGRENSIPDIHHPSYSLHTPGTSQSTDRMKEKPYDEESSMGLTTKERAEIKRTKTTPYTYEGRIKAGMGVQKRYTMIFVREVEEVRRAMERMERLEERDRVNFEIWRRFWRKGGGAK
ncbi:uncharacterized protein EAF01_007086 [Botrytis porri]|uniref:Uncharacterized protein n=1 Tax=Botrytis porri TaxID=87229 RepID=A0A4Z1KD39_9HELO|nr:uncharacterized protein EAF01_007086 [Botrytis porri]KAF7901787.1 hypothetical protein EAF01_007086 [Botrytis porri]TGO84017.1 hypothetical protein BPOR_0561g00030 [Botrytis porri]